MAEYIEREKALSAQNKSMNLSECRKRLERIPAADVRPVVRGEWKGVHSAECSECGHVFPAFLLFEHYCPSCGAEMERVE